MYRFRTSRNAAPILKAAVFAILGCLAAPVQAQDYRLGATLDPELYSTVPKAAPLARGDYLGAPARMSLKRFAPPVGDQGNQGSCVGWATAYAARTLLKAKTLGVDTRARLRDAGLSAQRIEGKAVVFDGPEDYHHRIDDPALDIDEHTLLFMRGAGPIGYPGAAEVVNMRPPAYLIKKGVSSLACIGDGRQSGTSGSPSILNASPEAAAGGNLAILKTGDKVRIDLNKGEADILISAEEIATRRAALEAEGGYKFPKHQTPWQEIQRAIVGQLGDGAILKPAEKYQRIAQNEGVPRDNH